MRKFLITFSGFSSNTSFQFISFNKIRGFSVLISVITLDAFNSFNLLRLRHFINIYYNN